MIEQTLRQTFGYDGFRAGQEQAIRAVVAGRSAAAIFPTGSGKSLCYQLPALLLPHLTLVVSPLLALMQDQLAFLHGHGIAAASIDSAQSREQTSETMARAKSGELKILMISVERLKNERFRHFISQVPISLLVVDEAHCISEWGHNFRPDYLKLPDYQRQFNIPQVLLLTATATPPVIADMQAKFSIAADDVVTTGFYRPNLNLLVEPVSGFNKQRRLVEWLTGKAGQPTIVYVTQQKTAEQIAEHLAQRGFPASAYHAGMAHELRESIQRRFMAGELNCIVATIAFGMGIDKADIRNVVHYDLPKSVENYSQEIGRAGRDGNASDCLVLANRDSLSVLQNFVYGDTPEREGIRCVLDELLQAGAGGQWELMLNQLSEQSNIRQLPLKTLLVQLELRGIIAPRFAYFAEYRFKYLLEPEALVAKFEGERRQFVEVLQIEMVEELSGGGEHRRAPRHVTMTDHANPLALLQRLDDLAVDRNAANVLDLAAGDGLAVGDQRQGFQQRPGITLRTLLPEPPDPGREALAHLQTITTGHLLEFEGAPLAGLVQDFEGLLQLRRRGSFMLLEQLAEALQGERLAGREQKGFEQRSEILGIGQVHG